MLTLVMSFREYLEELLSYCNWLSLVTNLSPRLTGRIEISQTPSY